MSEEAGLLIDQYTGYLKVDMSYGVRIFQSSVIIVSICFIFSSFDRLFPYCR